jgi:cell division protein FtsA
VSELICGIDVGTTKVVALIGTIDDQNNLRIIGVGRAPAQGLRRGVVVNSADATEAIGQAIDQAEQSAGQTLQTAYVGIAGSHVNAIGSKGVVAIGRTAGRKVTKDDVNHALEQASNIALPHNREIIHRVPRAFCVDDQRGIQDPVGMFGYRLEVDASIITGATSAVTNLVNCIQGNGVAIDDLVLQPLASGEAVLTDDERQLGVALVDIGGGTSDVAIYLDGAPWHTVIMDLAGEHFVKDVALGLRMPYNKAEALMMQFGHVLPEQVPADAEVRSGAFGQEGQQTVNCRLLAEILNARAEELVDLILREVKRSGYDGLLPAGIVLTGGVAQMSGLADLSRTRLQWPVRVGRPSDTITSVVDVTGPDYATAVGLLLWGLQRGTGPHPEPPRSRFLERVMRWLRALLPVAAK